MKTKFANLTKNTRLTVFIFMGFFLGAALFVSTFFSQSVFADHGPTGYTEAECSDRFMRGTFTREQFDACMDHARSDSGGGGSASGGAYQAASREDCEDDGGTYLGVPLENDENCIPPGEGEDNPIFVYLRPIIAFLSAGVGLIIVATIVISGIRYITSGGDPQKLQAAKGLLGKAIGGLLLYIFFVALLNFLVPGGIIN